MREKVDQNKQPIEIVETGSAQIRKCRDIVNAKVPIPLISIRGK